jgi:hypothetical protein
LPSSAISVSMMTSFSLRLLFPAPTACARGVEGATRQQTLLLL